MKLYYSPASPFVRKVMVVLHETGQFEEVEIVSAIGTVIDPGTLPLSQNPLGKIPALERSDGPTIYDSRVICRYLNARANAGLYPDGNRSWDVLTMEATADGIMDAAILMFYEGRLRPPEYQYEPWVDAQWGKVDRAIAAIDTRWISHLADPQLHIGQIAIACALAYCDFRLADRNWRVGYEALSDWYAEFENRESFQATIPAA